MKVVPPTRSQIYSAINEIDDLMLDYLDESPDSDHAGIYNEFGLVLAELGVNAKGLVQVASVAGAGLIKNIRNIQSDDHKFKVSTQKVIDALADSGKLDRDNDYYLFLATCWSEGFTTGMVIQEQSGKEWDEIPETFFEKLKERKRGTEYLSGLPYLMVKHVRDVSAQRCASLFYALQGKKKPVILPAFESRLMDIAAIAFMDAIYSTYYVDFRRPNDSL